MLMAHNSAFDMAFINAKSLKALNKRIYNDVLDNLDIARIFLPTLNNHKLETLVEHFNLYNERAHRAINDAEVTGKVFYKIIEYAAENIALDTMNFLYNVADYSEYSPALISIFEILRKHIIKYSLIKGQKTNNEKNLNYIKHEPKNHASYGINDIFEENGL